MTKQEIDQAIKVANADLRSLIISGKKPKLVQKIRKELAALRAQLAHHDAKEIAE